MVPGTTQAGVTDSSWSDWYSTVYSSQKWVSIILDSEPVECTAWNQRDMLITSCPAVAITVRGVVMCTEWLKGNVLSGSVGPSGSHQLQGQLDNTARQQRTAPDWQGCVHGQRLGRDLAPQPRSVAWTEVCGCEHLYQLLVLLLFQDHREHDLRRLLPGWKRRLSGACNCACVGIGTRTIYSNVLKPQLTMIKVISIKAA